MAPDDGGKQLCARWCQVGSRSSRGGLDGFDVRSEVSGAGESCWRLEAVVSSSLALLRLHTLDTLKQTRLPLRRTPQLPLPPSYVPSQISRRQSPNTPEYEVRSLTSLASLRSAMPQSKDSEPRLLCRRRLRLPRARNGSGEVGCDTAAPVAKVHCDLALLDRLDRLEATEVLDELSEVLASGIENVVLHPGDDLRHGLRIPGGGEEGEVLLGRGFAESDAGADRGVRGRRGARGGSGVEVRNAIGRREEVQVLLDEEGVRAEGFGDGTVLAAVPAKENANESRRGEEGAASNAAPLLEGLGVDVVILQEGQRCSLQKRESRTHELVLEILSNPPNPGWTEDRKAPRNAPLQERSCRDEVRASLECLLLRRRREPRTVEIGVLLVSEASELMSGVEGTRSHLAELVLQSEVRERPCRMGTSRLRWQTGRSARRSALW